MITHKGTQSIQTKRLVLWKFEITDTENMFNNWANDPEVTKFLSWPYHEDLSTTKKIINIYLEEYQNSEVYNWAIFAKKYGEVIGSITVVEMSNEKEQCEIGYCISKSYWNQGITTEALRAVINYLINEIGFKRIQAKHDSDNKASGKVMLKAGMEYEGRLRKYNKNNVGKLVDCDIYSILKEDLAKEIIDEN
jgi:ribosomal-protein-alanine N-acetyltransferase